MCKNCAKHIVYISKILNFNKEHGNKPIYKNLKRSWILNLLRKESIFLYSKRPFFYRLIGVFTALGVTIFRITLRDRAQIFLKKAKIYEKDDSICFHFLYTNQMRSVKRMWHEKNISYCEWHLLQCQLNKKILTAWKRTNWQLISTLLSLMIIKLGSQLKFICSNSTIETLEKHVKHVQS